MGLTNFPNGISSFGVPIFGSGGLMTQGNVRFVRPTNGSDTYSGKSPDRAYASLFTAQGLATADQNDVIVMMAESNTATYTTEYLATTATWDTDGVHLIGINAGQHVSQRSRIAWDSTNYDGTATPLVTWSADGCYCSGIQFISAINDAQALGCVDVTGDRNHFYNCHFAGIGHATQDAAGAYSLKLTGGENLFENCVIGLDTIPRGTAANSEILLSGGGERNYFKNCLIITYAEANTHQFLIKESAGIDRWCIFENCHFINPIQSAAVAMTEAFDITAGGSPNGLIYLVNCSLLGATDWEAATVSGEVYSFSTTSTAATTGLAVVVAAS